MDVSENNLRATAKITPVFSVLWEIHISNSEVPFSNASAFSLAALNDCFPFCAICIKLLTLSGIFIVLKCAHRSSQQHIFYIPPLQLSNFLSIAGLFIGHLISEDTKFFPEYISGNGNAITWGDWQPRPSDWAAPYRFSSWFIHLSLTTNSKVLGGGGEGWLAKGQIYFTY